MSQISLNESTWAEKTLNEPKQTQKTLSIFRMYPKYILYELKMGLNELK